MDYKILRRKNNHTLFGSIIEDEEHCYFLVQRDIPQLLSKEDNIENIKELIDNPNKLDEFELIPVQLLTILPQIMIKIEELIVKKVKSKKKSKYK